MCQIFIKYKRNKDMMAVIPKIQMRTQTKNFQLQVQKENKKEEKHQVIKVKIRLEAKMAI